MASLRGAIDWRALSCNSASPFSALEWFETLARTCAVPHSRLHLLTMATPEGESLLPLRQLQDGTVEGLSNFYTPCFAPAHSHPEALAAHAPHQARWLARQDISQLRLSPLDADGAFRVAFTQALRDQGFCVARHFAFGNWYQPCQGMDWAHYLASRPSRLRNTIVRTRKKLQADPSFRLVVLDAGTPADEMATATATFEAVYNRSWKRPEPYPEFIGSFARWAHAKGWLRIGLCFLDGQPVAAQLWIVARGVASIYKLAYDEAYAKRGVGTVLSAALFEHALDVDHVREIDFLTGDDGYKAEWMARRRVLEGLVAFNPRTARGLARAARHYGGQAWQRLRAHLARDPAPSQAVAQPAAPDPSS